MYGQEQLGNSHDGLRGIISSLIRGKHEGSYWDFKLKWHDSNAELMHDIICLANNSEGVRAYLIFGIEDENYEIVGIEEHPENQKNTQQLVDTLHNANWATTFPTVKVSSIILSGKSLDVITIDPDDHAIPYYLSKDFGKGKQTVRAGAIYSRNQDVNTARDETSTPLATEQLWRRHFALDKTPLQKLTELIKKPSEWKSTSPIKDRDNEAFAYSYYHETFPEFTFARVHNEENDAYEYPMLVSPFFDKPYWWDARFYYHQTMIYETTGYYSDHLYIAAPEISVLKDPTGQHSLTNPLAYYYYLSESIDDSLTKFELDESKEGSSASGDYRRLMETIPVFSSSEEKGDFEDWLYKNWGDFSKRCNSMGNRYVPPRIPAGKYVESYSDDLVKQANMSAAIVEMLDEWHFRTRWLTRS